jgi:molybdate transport system ATP-binding protein
MLHAAFSVRRGTLALDVDLRVAPGETVALIGPNGAGKTSCLRAVAGLLPIERGRIAFDGEVLDGGPGGEFVPPERRGAGFVFQDHLLFPHLTARDNVAYGLRCRGVPRGDAARSADEWLGRVGLEGLGDARPLALSGGQCQRIALARALACSTRILLLDEPLAAVDASARLELRRELRAHLQAFAGVRLLVAHSAVDAFALADRIVVIEDGRVVQTGTAAAICGEPRSRYVADLVGLNFVRGRARGGAIELPGGGALVSASALDGPVIATVHPRAIALYRERPAGSPRNVWQAPIVAIESTVDCVRIQLGGAVPLVAEITAAALAELRAGGSGGGGSAVWVALKATEVQVAPA